MTHVDIREVSLRDGLQIEKPIPLSAKLELLAAVAATGVREVEATAFVSPSKVPSMADAAELAAELRNYPDIEFSALVASPNGAMRAVAAGLRSIEYVVSTSDAFSTANVGRSSKEATDQIDEIVAIAHDSDVTVEVIVATAWDCPFEGPTPPQRVLDIAATARDRGVDRFSIAGTTGTYHGSVELTDSCDVLGFRIENFAYCTDCNEIPLAGRALLSGLEVLIIDGLRARPHPTHLSFEQAVALSSELSPPPKRVIFTHVAHDMAHADIEKILPPHVRVGYDGMKFTVG